MYFRIPQFQVLPFPVNLSEVRNRINTVWEIHCTSVRSNRKSISVSTKRTMNKYVKYDIPIEDTKIKNRFEIRLKNERAYYAVRDLLTYHDAERTVFDIINRYMRFADREVEKRRSEWKTNEKWAYFIGSERGRLKLTTKPEPYTLTKDAELDKQTGSSYMESLDSRLDRTNGTTYLKDILDHAKLTERHKNSLNSRPLPQRKSLQNRRNDNMKHILFDLFLVSLGAGIGVVTMCLIQAGKAADRDFEMMERRKEIMNFGQNLYNWFYLTHRAWCLWQSLLSGVYLGFKREFSNLSAFW